MKVLLVEDEEFIRDLFKRQLDLSGFATDAFSNGQDGLAAISKNAYDLVLLDIMLPDINGLQILQNIRQNPATKGVAVVLLTNLGQDAVIKQGFELGADGYLVKAAYTPDQIVQEVKNIMQKKASVTQAAPAPAPATPQMSTSSPIPATAPAFPGQAVESSNPTPMFSSTPPGATSAPPLVAPTSDPMGMPQQTAPPPDPLSTPQPITAPTASEIAGVAASSDQPVPASPEVTSTN